MTIVEWNAIKSRLNRDCREARAAGNAEWNLQALRLRAEHDAFRPIVEAETRRVRATNRAIDAARKSGQVVVVQPRANEAEWLRAERRYQELESLERLMRHRTGVNVGHP